MKEQEIIEGNKLIAEFMGLVQMSETRWELPHPTRNKIYKGLEYDSSWHWLMPVVEKIESLFEGNISVVMHDKRCQVQLGTQYGMTTDVEVPKCYSGYCETKLQATYNSVVDFIKWHNINKAIA